MKGQRRKRNKNLVLPILIVMLLGLGVYTPTAKTADLPIYADNITSDFTRVSITADFHLEQSINRTRMIKYLQAISSFDPQVIVLCGDYYSGTSYSPPSADYGYGTDFPHVYAEIRAAVDQFVGNDVLIFIAGNHDHDMPDSYYRNSGFVAHYGLVPTLNFDVFLFGSPSKSGYTGTYSGDQINAMNTYLASRPDKTKPVLFGAHFPIDQDVTWNATNAATVDETLNSYDQPSTFLWAHKHVTPPVSYYQEHSNYTTANAGAISYSDTSFSQGLNIDLVPRDNLHYSWIRVMTTGGSMSEVESLTQTLPIPTFALTYTAGSGGTIAGTSPQTIEFGQSGTAVTAVPGTGYHFTGWSDGISEATRTDTNVTSDINVTANFAADMFTLTYTTGSGGMIAGTSPQTIEFGQSGTAVTALADTGYHFTGWSDGISEATRTDTNVTGDVTVTASFAADTFTLTYTAGTGGIITGTTLQTVAYGGSGTSVTAVAETDYRFVSWNDGLTTATRTDSNITTDGNYAASFEPIPITYYTLTYTAGAGGSISGTTPQSVAYGGNGTAVTAVPNTGYKFTSWSDGFIQATRTEINVEASATFMANFSLDIVPVTSVVLDRTSQTLTIGESTTLAATVKPDNATNKNVVWSSNKSAVARVSSTGVVTANKVGVAQITVTTVDGSYRAYCTVTVTKTSIPTSFTITYVAGPNGTISGATTQTIASNGTGTPVTAKPNVGYRFVKWSDGLTNATRTESGVTANDTYTAEFAINSATVPVTNVSLNKETTTLVIGSQEQLIATVLPGDATNKKVVWTTDKSSIATVNTIGVITAKRAGTAIVTVITEDGAFRDTCVVTVTRR